MSFEPTDAAMQVREAMPVVRRHIVFAAACLVLGVGNLGLMRELWAFSLQYEFASHILLIPLISAALIFRSRSAIFAETAWSPALGGVGIAAGVAVSMTGAGLSRVDFLALKIFALIVVLLGILTLVYGVRTFRAALFPLMFLFLAVPIPERLLAATVASLQMGSAEGVAWLFKLTGTPFYRVGTAFALPGVSIEVASQCSGIRSSLALFIASLLAGYLVLKSGWRRTVLVLVAVPLAMLKNAIRIVVLSLLAIHVDVRYLSGSNLHRRGGILFYLLALAMLAPVLWMLRRGEHQREDAKTRRLEEIDA